MNIITAEPIFDLITQTKTLPCEAFKWRDKKGVFHTPKSMETRHLFYTLRMIWNHSMLDTMRIEPYTRYTFNSFYTPAYMKEAIQHVGTELFKRNDLLPEWEMHLRYMAACFMNEYKENLLVEPLLLLECGA